MQKISLTLLLTMFLIMPSMVFAKVKIDNTVYDTLDEAVEKVKEGETIILLDDVDVTDITKYGSYYNWDFKDNVTLDLNNHTIVTGRNKTSPTSVWLGNNLTIKNGIFMSKYKLDNSEDFYEADYALFLGDEKETSNITLENISVTTGINIYNTLNVTLKNVNAVGKKYYAVWLDEHATATIESGNFSSNGVAVLGITTNSEFNSELTINGGVFKASKGKLSLSEAGNAKYLPPIIKGGTYDFDVTDFVAKDYLCTNKDGKYIVEKDYKLKVNNTSDLKIDFDNKDTSLVLFDTLEKTETLEYKDKDINILLDMVKLEISEDILNKISTKIDNIQLANCFDITIKVIDKKTSAILGNLTELSDKIVLSVNIPDDIEKIPAGFKRKYYILREHNNIIDVLDVTSSSDNKTLSFETDRFSTYALAYKDTKVTSSSSSSSGGNGSLNVDRPIVDNNINDSIGDIENPNTLDNLPYIIVVVVILISIISLSMLNVIKNISKFEYIKVTKK